MFNTLLLQISPQTPNYFTDKYGISNISMMADAAFAVAGQMQQVAIPVAGLAIIIMMFRTVTNLFIGDGKIDMMRIAGFFGCLLFLGFYSEIMSQVLGIVQYFSDAVDSKIGTGKLGFSNDNLAVKYANVIKNQPAKGTGLMEKFIGFEFTHPLNWLMAALSNETIVIARSVTYCIREVSLMFLMAVGPLAIVISLFPAFEGGLSHWFKHFISVSFWGVSLGVIDRLFCSYLDSMILNNSTEGFLPMTLGLTLMYCMAPLLTSKFINQGASAVMSRVVGYASRTVKSGGNMAASAISSGTKEAAGTVASSGVAQQAASVGKTDSDTPSNSYRQSSQNSFSGKGQVIGSNSSTA